MVAKFQKIAKVAYRKLKMLNNADRLADLNRLRKMTGEWKGYYRIWINDQYRIIFQWGQELKRYDKRQKIKTNSPGRNIKRGIIYIR